jgi:hypothetical protein
LWYRFDFVAMSSNRLHTTSLRHRDDVENAVIDCVRLLFDFATITFSMFENRLSLTIVELSLRHGVQIAQLSLTCSSTSLRAARDVDAILIRDIAARGFICAHWERTLNCHSLHSLQYVFNCSWCGGSQSQNPRSRSVISYSSEEWKKNTKQRQRNFLSTHKTHLLNLLIILYSTCVVWLDFANSNSLKLTDCSLWVNLYKCINHTYIQVQHRMKLLNISYFI